MVAAARHPQKGIVPPTSSNLGRLFLSSLLLLTQPQQGAHAWNILLPGGTGRIGATLASQYFLEEHEVTLLARNAFLAATPSRVTNDYGWVGAGFLQQNPHVRLRDWDGGDLLDIVGQDWMGWQDDALRPADIVVHLTGGGFTEQRVLACERLVRESMRVNPRALHVTVNPTNELLSSYLSPGIPAVKRQRIERCEALVRENCVNHVCLRLNERKVDQVCQAIVEEVNKAMKTTTMEAAA